MKIKCKKCGYEWATKSILNYVSCPSCLNKVKNTANKEDDKHGK